MKTLILFLSRTGHNKKLANEIKNLIDADIEELKDQENRKGVIGYMKTGYQNMTKQKIIINNLTHNPADYDLVILVTPFWAWSITLPTEIIIKRYKDQIKNLAVFSVSQAGQDNKPRLQAYEEILNKKLITSFLISDKELKEGQYHESLVAELNKIT